MNEYHFGPLGLRSALTLPELCEIGPDSPATQGSVTVATDDQGLANAFSPIHVDERSAYALGIDSTTGVATMRHEDSVDYLISAELDHVTVRAIPTVDPSTVRHLLLDQVLPRLLEARGAFVLHASGVETERGGMLFLGTSGSGKSSLAAAFGRAGSRMLGDDCFTVEIANDGLMAATTYPSLRLLPDAITEFVDAGSVGLSAVAENRLKLRIDQDTRLPPPPGQISTLFVIDLATDHQGPPEVRPLPSRHGILQLVRNSFRFHNDGSAAHKVLASAEEILQRVALYELRYERNYEQLDGVVAEIMKMPEFGGVSP